MSIRNQAESDFPPLTTYKSALHECCNTPLCVVLCWDSGRTTYLVLPCSRDPMVVHSRLRKMIKNDPPYDEIRIADVNFSPITNYQHFLSAGYDHKDLSPSDYGKPAHFNPPFFTILGICYA